ncbi:uncharacterized protein LOC127763560 [Oryza glaberrima]|uniref:SET domain-containing protein n=1 Tax=Oryza glumipatula TaxID=40148 RepID=A0A0D9YVD7_9ORYZ|nr:uncharacterized protein LOC127763560 [Oryza glaberrima]XP_052144258.1 uncharacterized protein LOC127763560 [Oryza glaberrima]
MGSLFIRFQEAVKTLAKNPMFANNRLFARDPRHLQFEADVNRLFLYTSYYRLGANAEEKDAEEIIDMASKASVSEQQKQVQENVHYQLTNMCQAMDSILLPDTKNGASEANNYPRRSGLSFAVGTGVASANKPDVPSTRPLNRAELSNKFRDHFQYTLDIRPSQIPHKDAGQGLFLSGETNAGAVLAIYPGVVYSPAYYRYIPGYPKIDACNNYLITRYDGTIIDAKPWQLGGDSREIWDGSDLVDYNAVPSKSQESNSDRAWRMLSKPLKKGHTENFGEVLERRNPLAFGHFANHPPKGSTPNVMICPYDFPLTEKDMRVYIPNITFGGEEEPVTMKRFGSFWFKSGRSGNQVGESPVLKTLVLVSTRSICDEELFLNYRYSNSKKRPEWYIPVDEEEDKRRWS